MHVPLRIHIMYYCAVMFVRCSVDYIYTRKLKRKMGLIAIVTFWMASFLCMAVPIEAARILAIIPIPSYSHQIPYRPIWITLSQRGHEVVVLTTDPINNSNLTNLTEIDFKHNYEQIQRLDFLKNILNGETWITTQQEQIEPMGHVITENIYQHDKVRKMYAPNSDQKFDVVIAEVLITPGLYALAHRFNAPLIGILSLGLVSYNMYLQGIPVLPSHPSSWEMRVNTDLNLSLWKRITNFIDQWYHLYHVLNNFYPHQQMLAEKYLGKNIPDISDLERNISIILYNQQEVLSFVRPTTPNFIPFGNLHVSKKSADLPKDLKDFMADAPNGFIYMSLGTNVKISSFPNHVLDIFIDVFASLPYKIVWKLDKELPNKLDNIYTAQWFAQQSILAHPNIRMFIYQGGLQSTEEAVHYAVPLLGLPILADQFTQVLKMVTLGVAKKLNVISITKEDLNASIIEIISDKRYKERMLELKALNEDKPYNLLENTIWWIEFVIRHKSALHLHTSIANEPWYKRYDTDIIAILSIVTFIILLSALIIIYKLIKISFTCFTKTSVDTKKKIN
nr:PREDICTED: UDP-glucuronosyltransferase-like isoform X1 [Linepithema humile]XP_012218630.1 PREDICTED: UDP-glucuronosyltransferase-like isoform X1 [Linepithema humile]